MSYDAGSSQAPARPQKNAPGESSLSKTAANPKRYVITIPALPLIVFEALKKEFPALQLLSPQANFDKLPVHSPEAGVHVIIALVPAGKRLNDLHNFSNDWIRVEVVGEKPVKLRRILRELVDDTRNEWEAVGIVESKKRKGAAGDEEIGGNTKGCGSSQGVAGESGASGRVANDSKRTKVAEIDLTMDAEEDSDDLYGAESDPERLAGRTPSTILRKSKPTASTVSPPVVPATPPTPSFTLEMVTEMIRLSHVESKIREETLRQEMQSQIDTLHARLRSEGRSASTTIKQESPPVEPTQDGSIDGPVSEELDEIDQVNALREQELEYGKVSEEFKKFKKEYGPKLRILTTKVEKFAAQLTTILKEVNSTIDALNIRSSNSERVVTEKVQKQDSQIAEMHAELATTKLALGQLQDQIKELGQVMSNKVQQLSPPPLPTPERPHSVEVDFLSHSQRLQSLGNRITTLEAILRQSPSAEAILTSPVIVNLRSRLDQLEKSSSIVLARLSDRSSSPPAPPPSRHTASSAGKSLFVPPKSHPNIFSSAQGHALVQQVGTMDETLKGNLRNINEVIGVLRTVKDNVVAVEKELREVKEESEALRLDGEEIVEPVGQDAALAEKVKELEGRVHQVEKGETSYHKSQKAFAEATFKRVEGLNSAVKLMERSLKSKT